MEGVDQETVDAKTRSTMEDVCITFRARIEPGESRFVIPVHRKFAHEPNRRYGFESITVMPEYQNTQAFAYKLDSQIELDSIVKHPLQLEVGYGPNYFSKDAPGKMWNYLQAMSRIDQVLASVNQYYDRNKPGSTFCPPVLFDWVHLEGMNEGETLRQYVESTAEDAYGEPFDAAKHATWKPMSATNLVDMNPCIFPTKDNEDYLADVRIRMWIAPNTTITFSNSTLPQALGFMESQIPEKTKKGQVPFSNSDTENYKVLMCFDQPTMKVPATVKGTKINCYTTSDIVLSPVSEVVTMKKRERDPSLLAEDYGNAISALAKKINVFMGLEYNAGTKTFKVVYPTNRNISVRLHLPPYVMRQLGFDPYELKHDFIDQTSEAKPVRDLLDVQDIEKKARALVYDTGMIAVDLDEQSSHLSSHSGNFMMTTLHPREDGTLRNRIYLWDVPRVQVSATNPDLTFLLFRFDDENQKFPLGWPVGAYIFGTLNGRL